MFKFDTGYRKDFKTEEAFLRDVFQRNVNKIPVGVNKEMFVLQVQSYKVAYNTNITGALRKLANSEEYTPYTERAGDNVLKSLERFGQLKKFKSMIRDEMGHFAKYVATKLHWDPETATYVYNNKIRIDIRNSPERIEVTYIR